MPRPQKPLYSPGFCGLAETTGRLHRLCGGVYAVGHMTVSREGRWMAAVLAAGPEAVLSHWSAAALWRIRSHARSIIAITTPHKSRSWEGIRRHHKALLGSPLALGPGRALPGQARSEEGARRLGTPEERAARAQAQRARGTVCTVPTSPSPAPAPLQRLDRLRSPALPGGLPLAGHGAD